ARPALSPLSLHDALPISSSAALSWIFLRVPPLRSDLSAASRTLVTRNPDHPSLWGRVPDRMQAMKCRSSILRGSPLGTGGIETPDRKSTRLNSSHLVISY